MEAQNSKLKQIRGADIVIQSLLKEGVEVVFGYPGGANLEIYDALYDYQKKLKHILVRHEQGAAHAADGYARASGKVGVCIATSGPGATNLVTGIATAHMDSIPMVCITGQVATTAIGTDAFQEADIYGITMPITKHNYLVKDIKDLARIIKEAFIIARSGRPGPVLIDIPKDITIDIVALYRRAEEIYPHVEELVKRGGIETLWLPEGVRNKKAEEYATESGVLVISDFCIMKQHQKLAHR
jgi:acetolactate synthase-1/2/3 large subunit